MPGERKLGGELSKLRVRSGLTQKQLADLLDISTTALRNWEADSGTPTAQNLKKIISIYLAHGVFIKGQEEAKTLWELAQERGRKEPFDEEWFAELQTPPGMAVQDLYQLRENSDTSASGKLEDHSMSPDVVDVRGFANLNEAIKEDTNSSAVDFSQPDVSSLPVNELAIPRRKILIGLAGFVVGGIIGSGATWAVDHYMKVSPCQAKWNLVGEMAFARSSFRATTLKNGTVLIEGGSLPDGGWTSESVRFDPVSGTWAKTKGVLNVSRSQHTATLLPSGKVLVTGGFATITLTSAEIYDPASDTWTLTRQTMSKDRTRHTATLLRNGKVLIVGGVNHATSELYDPATDTWAAAERMAIPRADHMAVLMLDGRVLVAGGTTMNDGYSTTNNAEIYDPTTNTWTTIADMKVARAYCTGTLLPNGKVLVIGGRLNTHQPTPTTEIYSPALNDWSITGSMHTARENSIGNEALLLANGTIVIVGGDSQRTSETYIPDTQAWIIPLKLASSYNNGATTLLHDGSILVAGGDGTTSVEIYTPGSGCLS